MKETIEKIKEESDKLLQAVADAELFLDWNLSEANVDEALNSVLCHANSICNLVTEYTKRREGNV